MDITIEDEAPKKAKTKKAKPAKAKPTKAKASKGKPAKKGATKKAIKPAADKPKKAKEKKEAKAPRRSPYKLTGTRVAVKVDSALVAEVNKLARARKVTDEEALEVVVSSGLARLAALSRYANKE